MPLINGQKMACEPCIRGHRSTKCTHANERLMVPVRKPGRPLSSCPHPSSRSCSCAAVTAAIPRKHTCHCGGPTVALSDASLNEEPPHARDATSMDPLKPTNASFRVQKLGCKNASTKKHSLDLAGLQRMDASHVKILPACHATQRDPIGPEKQRIPASFGPRKDDAGLAQNESPFYNETTLSSLYHSDPSLSIAPSAVTHQSMLNGHGELPASTVLSANVSLSSGGACAAGTGITEQQSTIQQMPTPPSPVSESEPRKPRSCCSGNINSNGTSSAPESLPAAALPQPVNGLMLSSVQPPPMALENGLYPPFTQPTTFNYPPQFGSYLQPLQPEQWRHFMAMMSVAQTMAAGSYETAGIGALQSSASPNGTAWTSHECNCGDSCQCVGCAAHPYNEATQNCVRSAWNTMIRDGQEGHQDTLQDRPGAVHKGAPQQNAEQIGCRTPIPPATPMLNSKEGTISPAASQPGSDAEEQSFSANDFFFVSYPFDDSCAGETASCPCGDDCQCIGCVIHNNSTTEEADGAPS